MNERMRIEKEKEIEIEKGIFDTIYTHPAQRYTSIANNVWVIDFGCNCQNLL